MHANVGLASTGIWSVGRMGKLILGNYKEAYANASTALDVAEAALEPRRARPAPPEDARRGAKDPSHRARPLRARPPESPEGRWSRIITAMITLAYEDPGGLPPRARAARRASPSSAPCRCPPAQRTASPAPKTSPGHRLGPRRRLGRGFPRQAREHQAADLRPALDRRRLPEQFYLPADVLRVLHRPWTPERTIRLLASRRDHRKTVIEEERRSAGPTRNGPCPCGSGKKYKRCCGRAPRAPPESSFNRLLRGSLTPRSPLPEVEGEDPRRSEPLYLWERVG